MGTRRTGATSVRITLSDPSYASDLRAYFRRLDAIAVDNDDGPLEVYLLKPFSAPDDERALVRSYLRVWVSTRVPAELPE